MIYDHQKISERHKEIWRRRRANGDTGRKIVPAGSVFGRLTVIGDGPDNVTPSGRTKITLLCKCECGNEKPINKKDLLQGNTRSCGCGNSRNKSMRERFALMREKSGVEQAVKALILESPSSESPLASAIQRHNLLFRLMCWRVAARNGDERAAFVARQMEKQLGID